MQNPTSISLSPKSTSFIIGLILSSSHYHYCMDGTHLIPTTNKDMYQIEALWYAVNFDFCLQAQLLWIASNRPLFSSRWGPFSGSGRPHLCFAPSGMWQSSLCCQAPLSRNSFDPNFTWFGTSLLDHPAYYKALVWSSLPPTPIRPSQF